VIVLEEGHDLIPGEAVGTMQVVPREGLSTQQEVVPIRYNFYQRSKSINDPAEALANKIRDLYVAKYPTEMLQELGFEIAVEYSVHDYVLRIGLRYGNKRIAQSLAPDTLMRDLLEDDYVATRMAELVDVKRELYSFKLEAKFPHSIKNVELERDMRTMQELVTIIFKNGQRATTPVEDFMSEEFLAKCAMVHDL
jgi:hypothetical protein